MVLWKDKNLSFARKPTEGRSVQDAVAITFKAGAKWVCLFSNRTIASTKRASSKRGEYIVLTGFALDAVDDMGAAGPCPRISVCKSNAIAVKAMHGLSPCDCTRMGFA
jgi:hypothetical protein